MWNMSVTVWWRCIGRALVGKSCPKMDYILMSPGQKKEGRLHAKLLLRKLTPSSIIRIAWVALCYEELHDGILWSSHPMSGIGRLRATS